MGELKDPLLYPEFVPCMMLNQEEEKQEVVLAALGGQENCPIGQADPDLSLWSQSGMTQPPEAKFPPRKVPRG